MRRSSPALAVILTIAAAASASAQERQAGFKLGASLASVRIGSASGGSQPYDIRAGLTGGGFFVLPVHRRLDVQIEALLTNKGGTLPIDDPNIIQGSSASKLLFTYADVPVLLRVRGPLAGRAALHVFGGPTFSVRLRATSQYALGGIGGGTFGYEDDIGRDVRRFDYGATLGAGASVGRFVLDGRYTFGLSDVFKDSANDPLRHRGFLLTGGYRVF